MRTSEILPACMPRGFSEEQRSASLTAASPSLFAHLSLSHPRLSLLSPDRPSLLAPHVPPGSVGCLPICLGLCCRAQGQSSSCRLLTLPLPSSVTLLPWTAQLGWWAPICTATNIPYLPAASWALDGRNLPPHRFCTLPNLPIPTGYSKYTWGVSNEYLGVNGQLHPNSTQIHTKLRMKGNLNQTCPG